MPNEIELKLRVPAGHEKAICEHPALLRHAVGAPLTRALISIYYDTPALDLLDARLSLRVRNMSGGWFQAVKSAGHSVGGLHQRLEWEDLLDSNAPNFEKITEPHLAHFFSDPVLREALKPIFVVDVIRTDWQLHYADGTELEVSLDVGEIRVCASRDCAESLHGDVTLQASTDSDALRGENAPAVVMPLNELEIELKSGDMRHLFDLALALQASIPLMLENSSKAQKGYQQIRPEHTIRTHSQASKVNRAANPKSLALDYLKQIQMNQEILEKINHAASVSQIRYAVSQLLAQMKIMCVDSEMIQSLMKMEDVLARLDRESQFITLQNVFNSHEYQRLLLRLVAWTQADLTGVEAVRIP